MIHYVLPFPPTDNHYYTVDRGRKVLSARGRSYRKTVWALLREQGERTLMGAVEMTVWLTMPDKRRRDLSNVMKALGDALQYGGAYRDDVQIDRLLIERNTVQPPGRADVWLREL